jgi:hypothetical protein
MTKRLDREFGRFDVDALDSQEYQAMPREHRNHAYLYLLMLTGWSRKRRTDGQLPRNIAADIARRMAQRSSTLLPVLEAIGMVIVTPEQVTLTRYEKWQETRAEIESRQQEWRDRQTKHRSVTPMSQHTVTRDTPPMSRVSHATEIEKEIEKEISNALKSDPATELGVAMHELLGRVLSAVDLIECQGALNQYAYLTAKDLSVRAIEHVDYCKDHALPPPRTVAGFSDTWRRENDYRADHGNAKADRVVARVAGGMTKAFPVAS